MSVYERDAEGRGYFFFQPRGEYDTPAHFHSAIEFLFVESGEEEVIIDGEKRILTADEACFSNSFSVHAYTKKAGAVSYTVLGDKQYFEPIFAAFGHKTPPKFFKFYDFDLLRSLLRLCQQNYENEASRYATFEGSAKILTAIIAEKTPFVAHATDKQTALVCNVLQYAEKRLCDDLSLRAIAQAFGYSVEHLSRTLRKYLQENWSVYINRRRIRRAETMLKENGDLSVIQIAYDCGFDSPNTFYRAYKKEFGKPPRRYKHQ